MPNEARFKRVSPEADTLRRALAVLSKRDGWIQHPFPRPGQFCALVAIGDAAGDLAANRRAVRAFCKAIGEDDVVAWNDDPRRTKREVLAAFRRAIKMAEERGPLISDAK